MTFKMKMSVALTGLADGIWEKNVKVGEQYTFYNGSMSRIDGKKCRVLEKYNEDKFKVAFEDEETFLAYNTELMQSKE